MIFLKLLGLCFCVGFVALFVRFKQIASAMTDACDSLPMAEGWDEEEFSTNDPVRFRVESEEWEPVSIEREF